MTSTRAQQEILALEILGAIDNTEHDARQNGEIAKRLKGRVLDLLAGFDWEYFSELSACAKRILAVAYPKFATVLTQDLDIEEAGGGRIDFGRSDCAQIILIKVIHGVESFESCDSRRSRAKELARFFKSPLPKPTTPFNDENPYMTFDD